MIAGQYEDGVLTGLGKVIMKDDTVRQGTFQHGYLHGPVRCEDLLVTPPHQLLQTPTDIGGQRIPRMLHGGPGLRFCE